MKNFKPRVLITAGPTREAIDPVCYISNRSSGKMGYALAEAAQKMGHPVTLISGPVHLAAPRKVDIVPVESAREMLTACLKYFQKHDIIIMVAAVADYRLASVSEIKIKKTKNTLTLKLIKNPDILQTLGSKKTAKQILVGFAAETHQVKTFALEKLKKKNLDWIIANDVSKKGIGFDSENNAVTLFGKNGEKIEIKKMAKKKLADKILANILASN